MLGLCSTRSMQYEAAYWGDVFILDLQQQSLRNITCSKITANFFLAALLQFEAMPLFRT